MHCGFMYPFSPNGWIIFSFFRVFVSYITAIVIAIRSFGYISKVKLMLLDYLLQKFVNFKL